MTILPLPTELWAIIATETSLDRKDHCSLVRVNRRFYDMFTPALYSSIQIFIERPGPSSKFSYTRKFELAGFPVRHLLELLDSSSVHRHLVNTVAFKNVKTENVFNDDVGYDQLTKLTESIIQLIARLPALKTLLLFRHHLQTDWVFRILSQSLFMSSLNIKECQLMGDVTISGSWAISSLELSSLSFNKLAPFVIGSHIKHLAVNVSLITLKAASSTHNLPLASLKSLSFSSFTRKAMDFFKSTPSLTKISIGSVMYGYSDDDPQPQNWQNMLPRLECFTGPSKLIPLFVSNRPITFISCYSIDDTYTSTTKSLSSLGPWFGSRTPVRIVKWSCCKPWDLLLYVVNNCADIQTLDLSACIERFSPIKPPDLPLSWIEEFKNLKHLRKLDIPILERDPLKWQEEQCALLHTSGCSRLEYISVNPMTEWYRHPDDSVWIRQKRRSYTLTL